MNHSHSYLSSLALLICMLTACSSKQTPTDTCHNISLEQCGDSIVSFSEVFQVGSIIPLETPEACLLSNIEKIDLFEGDYYLKDRKLQTVSVFGSTGKYKMTIGKVGQGPGEYSGISDFTIDRTARRIVVLSTTGDGSKVFVYDLQGRFLYDKTICKSLLWRIKKVKSGYLCTTDHQTYTEGDEAYLIYTFDEDFTPLGKWQPVLPQHPHYVIPSMEALQVRNDAVYFTDVPTHSIYRCADAQAGAAKAYDLQFGHPMTPEIMAETNTFMQHQREYDYLMNAIFMNDGQLLLFYATQGRLCISLSRPDGQQTLHARYGGIIPSFLPNPETGNLIYAMSAASYLRQTSEPGGIKTSHEIHPEDNFLLIHASLKKQ